MKQNHSKGPDKIVVEIPGEDRGIDISMLHSDPRFITIEARGPNYIEFFSVVTCENTVTVLAFDASDSRFESPQIHHVPKPLGWNTNGSAEDLLLQIWQATGGQR